MLTALPSSRFSAAPDNPQILYAALNPPPGEPGERDMAGESRIYISADQGTSWKQSGTEVTGKGSLDELGWL